QQIGLVPYSLEEIPLQSQTKTPRTINVEAGGRLCHSRRFAICGTYTLKSSSSRWVFTHFFLSFLRDTGRPGWLKYSNTTFRSSGEIRSNFLLLSRSSNSA